MGRDAGEGEKGARKINNEARHAVEGTRRRAETSKMAERGKRKRTEAVDNEPPTEEDDPTVVLSLNVDGKWDELMRNEVWRLGDMSKGLGGVMMLQDMRCSEEAITQQ